MNNYTTTKGSDYMEIVKTYGQTIEKLSEKNPDRAQKLLKLGWQAQNLKFRFFPNKQLLPADRYLAEQMCIRDRAHMGNGGFCLGCKECHYPNCSFGKGV